MARLRDVLARVRWGRLESRRPQQAWPLLFALAFAGPQSLQSQRLTLSSLRLVGGAGEPVFENVQAVAAGPAGGLVVLDRKGPTVNWLDRTGKVTARIDADALRVRRAAALVGGTATSYLLDGQGAEVLELGLDAGGKASIERRTRIKLSILSSMCRMNGTTYVMGRELVDATAPSKLIHAVGTSGAVVRSFGDPFSNLPAFGQIALGVGFLDCVPADSGIVMMSRVYPEIRGYSSTGQLRWKSPVADMRSVIVEMPDPTNVKYVYPADSVVDDVLQMVVLKSRVIAVQLRRGWGRMRRDVGYDELRTTFYSLDSGRSLWTQTDIPEIVGVNGDTLYLIKGADHRNVYSAAFTLSGR